MSTVIERVEEADKNPVPDEYGKPTVLFRQADLRALIALAEDVEAHLKYPTVTTLERIIKSTRAVFEEKTS